MHERSYHFIPADRPEFFSKIGNLPADAFIFDLEDAVAADKKSEAIRFLDSWLVKHNLDRPCFVRVNGPDKYWINEEIKLLNSHPCLGLVLPKTGNVDETRVTIRKYLGDNARAVILLIEDTASLPHVQQLSSLTNVKGIGIGLEDMLCNFRFPKQVLQTLVTRIRTEVALQCSAVGISAIDSISLDLFDGDELNADALAARAAGMSAMFSIHPCQINTIHRIFSPTPAEIKEARHIIAAAGTRGEMSGYQTIDGILLSPPKVRKASFILEFARHHEQ